MGQQSRGVDVYSREFKRTHGFLMMCVNGPCSDCFWISFVVVLSSAVNTGFFLLILLVHTSTTSSHTGNEIGDAGAASLSQVLGQCTALQYLFLSGMVFDQGFCR